MRWLEFFEGTGNQLSMTRLLMFMSFFPATYILIVTRSIDGLLYFLGAFVVGYIGGKGADCFPRRIISEVNKDVVSGDGD